jgi:hypothetical protein
MKPIIILVLGTALLFAGFSRTLLDVHAASLSFEQVAERLSHQDIKGATIIVHGFQLTDSAERGDSLMPLAVAVHENSRGWLIDYDIGDDEELGHFDFCPNCEYPDSTDQGDEGEVVLLFDWGPESNRLSDGWGEAAGDALFSMIIGLSLIDPLDESHIPLHFIGHSFGTAVASEAIERFARVGVLVDQVTYLDPHDFDQHPPGHLDGSQKLWGN